MSPTWRDHKLQHTSTVQWISLAQATQNILFDTVQVLAVSESFQCGMSKAILKLLIVSTVFHVQ